MNILQSGAQNTWVTPFWMMHTLQETACNKLKGFSPSERWLGDTNIPICTCKSFFLRAGWTWTLQKSDFEESAA